MAKLDPYQKKNYIIIEIGVPMKSSEVTLCIESMLFRFGQSSCQKSEERVTMICKKSGSSLAKKNIFYLGTRF